MSATVYIDGHVGTTGLRIREWLGRRRDIQIVTLPEERRKEEQARLEQMHRADVTVLCLPDQAAQEVANWVAHSTIRLIDASTAHRVAEGWVYGLPELEPGQRETIRDARRVANPGCYASAFVLLTRPLRDAGILSPQSALSVHALSGYSGGGRPLIDKWEDPAQELLSLPFEAPYALGAVHKHIPEMMRYSGLEMEPQFIPAVAPFRCGMRVEIPLHAAVLPPGAKESDIAEIFERRYRGEPFVRVLHNEEPTRILERSFDPRACNDTNRIELHIVPHPSGHVLLVALLDNLGKGACGVAIQNLNLMLGINETQGLLDG